MVTRMAITFVRAVETARAAGLARYSISRAVARMFSAVTEFTRPGRENVRDTVEGETPAALATS